MAAKISYKQLQDNVFDVLGKNYLFIDLSKVTLDSSVLTLSISDFLNSKNSVPTWAEMENASVVFVLDSNVIVSAGKIQNIDKTADEIMIAFYTIDLSNKTDLKIVGPNGTSLMFNESDGGGAKFEHTDGTVSFIGVNDGGSTGVTAQIYSKDKATGMGTRLNITNGAFYYVPNTNNIVYTADDELATLGDIKLAKVTHQSSKDLDRTILNTTTLDLTDLGSTITLNDVEIEQYVVDAKGTLGKISNIDTTNSKVDIVTLTTSYTNMVYITATGSKLNTEIGGTQSIDYANMNSGVNADDIELHQLVADEDGIVGEITAKGSTSVTVTTIVTSHKHDNKDVLDKLSEDSDGELNYDGNKVSHTHENKTDVLDKLSVDADGDLNLDGNKVSHSHDNKTDVLDKLSVDSDGDLNFDGVKVGNTEFVVYKSNIALSTTIDDVKSIDPVQFEGFPLFDDIEINQVVYDSAGTIGKVSAKNSATGAVEVKTMTISSGVGSSFDLYKSSTALSNILGNATSLDFADLDTTKTINDLKPNELVYDNKGTIANINTIDTINNKVNVITITIEDEKMPIAPDTLRLYVSEGGTGYTAGDIIETTTAGVFAEIVSVDASGSILLVADTTNTTVSTSGTGAIVEQRQALYGGYKDNWALLENAAILAAVTLVDKIEYETGYNFEITADGNGYEEGDIVETTVSGVNVKVTEVGLTGEIVNIEYVRGAANTSGMGATITATTNNDIFVIPNMYWTSGTALFSLTNDDSATVEFYRLDNTLIKYALGADNKLYKFEFNSTNGIITQSYTELATGSEGTTIKDYTDILIGETITQGDLIISNNLLYRATATYNSTGTWTTDVSNFEEISASHTHSNKVVIDKLSEDSDGDLNYNGTKIGGAVEISSVSGNKIEEKTDGLYVGPHSNESVLNKLSEDSSGALNYNGSKIEGSAAVSSVTGNQIQEKTDGLYVGKPSNSAVLDKLSVDTDGDLNYDGSKVDSASGVNAARVSLYSGSTISYYLSAYNEDYRVDTEYTLDDAVENYAYIEVVSQWRDGTYTYVGTHKFESNLGTAMQWGTSNWQTTNSSTNYGNPHSWVVSFYGKTMNVHFLQQNKGYFEILGVYGVKFNQVTDGTEFSHEHDNKSVLDLLTEPTTGTLAFRGTTVNKGNVTRTTLATPNIINTTSWSGTNTVVLSESSINFDALIFHIEWDNGAYGTEAVVWDTAITTYQHWFEVQWGDKYTGYIYKTLSNGNLQFTMMNMANCTHTKLTKIEGLKIAK